MHLNKKIVLLLFLSLIMPLFVSGQTHVRLTLQSYEAALTAKSYTRHNLNGQWGVFGYFLVQENWTEAYAGGFVAPLPWLEIGFGAGLEQFASNPYRVANIVWLGNRKVSMLNIVEYGGSGSWYQNILKYNVMDQLYLGLITQRFAGIGPYLEYSRSHVMFWGAPVHDWETGQNGLLIEIDSLF